MSPAEHGSRIYYILSVCPWQRVDGSGLSSCIYTADLMGLFQLLDGVNIDKCQQALPVTLAAELQQATVAAISRMAEKAETGQTVTWLPRE